MPYDESGNWVGDSTVPPQPNPYGYGTAPGQSNTGFYEQQTPAGSFAASDYSQGGSQQYANPYQASNQYIGQSAAQISGPQSVMAYAQGGQYYSPWLGQNSMQSQGVGPNPYGMGNPELQRQIQAAQGDATTAFNDVMIPQMDRQMQQSGSFGNAGLQAAQGKAYSDLGRNLGDISSRMRMQDYTQQQQLAENALGRQQQNNQFNSGLSSQDLSRNMQGGFQQANMNNGLTMGAAQFDAGNQLQTQMANANAYNGMAMNNAGLQQSQGQYNAGAQNAASQFNAGQSNQMNMYGQGQRNAMNMYNAGAGNQMLSQYRNNLQNQNQFDQSLGWQRDQFNQNMDFNVDQNNWNRMRLGQQDQIGLMDKQMKWNGQAVDWATQIQNMPLQYQQLFMNMANQSGQNGGSSSNNQTYPGSPWLGFGAGWNMGGGMYNNWGG